jgi:small GTP-binding protein
MEAIKIVIFGASSSGKSSILSQYLTHDSGEEFNPNIENRYHKILTFGSIQINLEIIDTSGQEKEHWLIEKYVKKNDGFILNFSIISQISFNYLSLYSDAIRQIKGSQSALVLVGNQCDLSNQREVKKSEAELKAKELQCEYFEASAKSGERIDAIFFCLVQKILSLRNSTKKSRLSFHKRFRKGKSLDFSSEKAVSPKKANKLRRSISLIYPPNWKKSLK